MVFKLINENCGLDDTLKYKEVGTCVALLFLCCFGCLFYNTNSQGAILLELCTYRAMKCLKLLNHGFRKKKNYTCQPSPASYISGGFARFQGLSEIFVGLKTLTAQTITLARNNRRKFGSKVRTKASFFSCRCT